MLFVFFRLLAVETSMPCLTAHADACRYVWQKGMKTLETFAKYSEPFEEIRRSLHGGFKVFEWGL